jgi:hypothetical protein
LRLCTGVPEADFCFWANDIDNIVCLNLFHLCPLAG